MTKNPYLPPAAFSESEKDSTERARWRPRFFLWLIAYTAPVLAAVAFYQSVLVATLSLGHWPRASIDDPKFIGGLMDISYAISFVAMISLPFALMLSFIACFYCPVKTPGNEGRDRVILILQYVTMCVLLWMLIRLDPGGVIYWWMD